MASEHPAMELARRGPKGNVDTFLAFWLGMLSDGRQAKFEVSRARTRRTMERFFADKAFVEARRVLGDDAMAAELRDAATLYFHTCRTDIAYTSTMFRTKRMSEDQVLLKAAKEAAGAVAVMRESGLAEPLAQKLPLLLLGGFLAEMGPESVDVLRGALAADPAAADLADLLDED